MVRYEVKSIYKTYAGCEDTLQEAKDYIAACYAENPDDLIEVKYYDNDKRIADIQNGKV